MIEDFNMKTERNSHPHECMRIHEYSTKGHDYTLTFDPGS